MKSFYERREWLELRFRVLNKYGWKCMGCNVTREDGAIIQVDHILPISIYPELALTESNLQVLCRECNLGKSNKHQTDFREKPATKKLGPLGIKVLQLAADHKERRRGLAYARLAAYIKRKLAHAEVDGDDSATALWMKHYLNTIRKASLEASA